jgi:hypothetical protein
MRPIMNSWQPRGRTAVAADDGFVVDARLSSTDFKSDSAYDSHRFLEFEAQALLTRLNRVKPFALQMTSVPAAAVSLQAQAAIEDVLSRGRRELRERVSEFLDWLKSTVGRIATAADAQRRFALLRLRFNAVLTQVDLFSDALVQRSEHEFGTWLGGLDVVAADALALPGYYDAPKAICYLDRGAGAAIRRARTRLPGGGESPVAIIRVPRERMIGSGIASSLVHEVGHQAAAVLDLVDSLRPELQTRQQRGGMQEAAWRLWERWISEIVADYWAIARVGVSSTTGLMAVVSLPRAFVFRVNMDDPHPFPWMRMKLSCALGHALFPDPQWQRLSRLWDSFYPLANLDDTRLRLISILQQSMPEFIRLLLQHKPAALRGQSLPQVLAVEERTPQRLRSLWQAWRAEPSKMKSAKPTLAFAVIGQARADGAISPKQESKLLGELLTLWALADAVGRSSTQTSTLTALHTVI